MSVLSRNIQVDSPYDISRAADELHYTYLDTFGRPVIVAYKKNLVEQHIQDIVVSDCACCSLLVLPKAVVLGYGSELVFPDTLFLAPPGALHLQQGAHAAGASAGCGCLLHFVLHRHRLRPSGLFHHQGTLLSS